ncbi:MAG: phage BR0599 family protein [Euryarchaeota archaeon]|nr:phage BR0599 family protein [Euryarchaeota archaeon]
MEYYEFSLIDTEGNAQFGRYNSGCDIETLNNQGYQPLGIKRNEISFDFDKNELSVTMPMNVWPASEFKLVNPYGVVEITIYNEAEVVIFDGRIKACIFKLDNGTAKLVATSVQEVLDSQVPVKTYSPTCPYEIYGRNCGVSAAEYVDSVTYGGCAVNGNEIHHSDFGLHPDGYYEGGWIETKYERTSVLSHVGGTVTLLYALREALKTTDILKIYPGCDKLLDTCSTKFNNSVVFGGFPWVPEKNPVEEEF